MANATALVMTASSIAEENWREQEARRSALRHGQALLRGGAPRQLLRTLAAACVRRGLHGARTGFYLALNLNSRIEGVCSAWLHDHFRSDATDWNENTTEWGWCQLDEENGWWMECRNCKHCGSTLARYVERIAS